MNGRKIIWVMRLPQINPPFAEDQRWRDGCMMPPITCGSAFAVRSSRVVVSGTAAFTTGRTSTGSPLL
jgi:hypothetical protein